MRPACALEVARRVPPAPWRWRGASRLRLGGGAVRPAYAKRNTLTLGRRWDLLLDEFEDVVSDNVATNIFDRHLKPVFLLGVKVSGLEMIPLIRLSYGTV